MKTDLKEFERFGKKGEFADRIDGTNCLVLTRVSSKEQEQGFSLETQKRVIDAECEKLGFNILSYFGGVYESAKTDERKEFNRMLKYAKDSKEKVSYIMVYSVDRFSRSGANAIYIADQLRKQNIKIYAVTQPADTFTPAGRMQQNMQFIFSEYDNDLRREKCVAGIKEMLLKGYWPNNPPMGYDQKTRRKRDNLDMEQRQIITINDKGKLIRKAFYWKAEDKLTNSEIMVKLAALGLKISKQQMCKVFTNPFYCGLMAHNVLNGEVVQGRHEGIVSKEIFLLANSVKSRNGVWTHRKDFENIPLKNFLKCGDCGSSFCGYLVKRKGLWYYKCNKTGCKCNKNAQSLNTLFEKELSKYQIDPKYKEPIILNFTKYFDEAVLTAENDIKSLVSRLNEVSSKVEALEERFAIGEIERELYLKYIGKFRKERSDIDKEIQSNSFKNSNLEKRVEKYCNLLANLPQLWASSDYRAKNELQNFLFPQGILYNRENNSFRTNEINDVALLMSQLSGDAAGKHKGDVSDILLTSPSVPSQITNLNELFADVKELARIWDMYGHVVK